jgi:ABC-type nitrate/sulfonate/bicarbonate transport system substrate-binding protein
MNWPYYVARDEGAFVAAGIEIEEHIYSATRDAVSALLEGALEVAHVIPDRGWPPPLRAVARVLDRPTYRLFGRPGRVGVSALDSGDGILVRTLLRHLGTDGELVRVGDPEARVTALLAGRVEATMVSEPFTFTLEDAGVPLLGDLRQALPDFPFVLCVVRENGPAGLETYLDVLRRARERLRDPASAAVLAGVTGCTLEVAERVRRLYLRDGHLGRFEP